MDADRAGDQLAEAIDEIRNNVPDGDNRLLAVLGGGMRFLVARRVRKQSDTDRIVNECVRTVVSAIREGRLLEPGAVVNFTLSVIREQAVEHIGEAEHNTHSCDSETIDLFGRALLRLARSDREILWRFYSQREAKAEIESSMGLTGTDFQLQKSRAKARLAKRVQRLNRPSLATKLLNLFRPRPQCS